MTDRDLIDRIRAGDEPAFEGMFREHYQALVGFARQFVDGAAAAEEIVQSLFTDLWVKRDRLVVESSVRAYLFTAVRNRALNSRRRAKFERDWDEAEDVADTDAMQWAPEPADLSMERAELHARLAAAVQTLPERCRLVMRLRWGEQMSYAEIAEAMGISIKGVENQLARGLKALRERL